MKNKYQKLKILVPRISREIYVHKKFIQISILVQMTQFALYIYAVLFYSFSRVYVHFFFS